MSETPVSISITDNKNFLEKFDDIYNVYSTHASKATIFLSILGGVASILSAKAIIATSIVIGVTNIGLFFSGVMTEKIISHNKILFENNKLLNEDNKSLVNNNKDMARRMTVLQVQPDFMGFDITPENKTQNDKTPSNSSTISYIEPLQVNFKY